MADEQIQTPPNVANQHTGKRAQRIQQMRDTLWAGIQRKNGKLDRDFLIAMKMLMALDGITGVQVSEAGGKRERKPRKPQPEKIKLPALLESA